MFACMYAVRVFFLSPFGFGTSKLLYEFLHFGEVFSAYSKCRQRNRYCRMCVRGAPHQPIIIYTYLCAYAHVCLWPIENNFTTVLKQMYDKYIHPRPSNRAMSCYRYSALVLSQLYSFIGRCTWFCVSFGNKNHGLIPLSAISFALFDRNGTKQQVFLEDFFSSFEFFFFFNQHIFVLHS